MQDLRKRWQLIISLALPECHLIPERRQIEHWKLWPLPNGVVWTVNIQPENMKISCISKYVLKVGSIVTLFFIIVKAICSKNSINLRRNQMVSEFFKNSGTVCSKNSINLRRNQMASEFYFSDSSLYFIFASRNSVRETHCQNSSQESKIKFSSNWLKDSGKFVN